MEHERGLIKNIVIIAVLLAVVFLSQSSSFRPIAQIIYNQASEKISPYTAGAGNWFKANIYPRIKSEAAKRGEEAAQEITTQKDNVAQNLWEKIKNFFAEKFSKFFGTKVK
ncbi:MAG: hypothetical protein A3C58_01410 [Candidatus Staskawiczbacteria bacterium RIFCSPHIGHO2_02_FULL_34_10]|uniref:Uncharacterized protein n=2 Tax=Candidatus Staskawicziibacteriota TaxID=1817916 RepID=A0A1G2HKC1_9BACT|nr:MAG: hypothetical protein A2639_01645 [Candidatus Staskawiczbacteria bacterium RIFCSPHIGHO2_01_FULL_34_27]OGZ67837.1 MAG: hypothetical protein A3C58_01410 [Candidatus Staskawiczbacteria bacterium RIFCSPHIGHO2_02_FULL_34_10]